VYRVCCVEDLKLFGHEEFGGLFKEENIYLVIQKSKNGLQ
jgi:hypothetical protein